MNKPYVDMWRLWWSMVVTCGEWMWIKVPHNGDTWLHKLTIDLISSQIDYFFVKQKLQNYHIYANNEQTIC
jgi:hypothetical protein